MSERTDKAVRLFHEGYNCSQSVFAYYADLFGIDEKTALKLSAGFGGGCGRQRELCGAVSGAVMVIGLKYGATDGADRDGKKLCYEKVREFTDEFKKTNPSIVCRELLLGTGADSSSQPEERTQQYYKKRPCAKIVEDSARALEKTILREML